MKARTRLFPCFGNYELTNVKKNKHEESYNKYYVLIGSFFIFCISSVIIVILYRVKLTQFEIIFNIGRIGIY